MPNLRQSTHQLAIPSSVYACCKVFQSICSVFCNFMSLLFFLSPCVSSRVLPSTCPPCFCGYEICDTAAAAPLQKLRTQKQICGEKWTGSERDWRPSWSCDAVTSTPAPLAPYQPARPTLLIEPAASQSPAEIDCAAVSITSDSYTPPPPSSLLRGVQLPRSGPCWLFICYGLFSFEPE